MAEPKKKEEVREWLAKAFEGAEDVLYIGLGLLLAAAAFSLLVTEIFYFGSYLLAGTLSGNIVLLLDRILLIIMLVEVLYTVQVSFAEHTLRPEPFLIVGMIAVTRRILVLTAEMSKFIQEDEPGFRNAMIELALLTALIVTLVISLRLLQRPGQKAIQA
ncbi:MAG TPA: phosphate-starvation-inducible PsiE family protein [Candidatus Binatia bacterium]|jgi:uncharacterized membrane protein (DUF373 family)|nr:phosphate-starvation-inducible PsiE family protein [Candidatus Binatia bacterium]